LLARYLTTATDVLRLLAVWSGGDPDLLEPPADFALRVRDGWRPDSVRKDAPLDGGRAFLALLQADLPGIPEAATGTMYRLYPGPSDAAAGFTRVTAGDLVAGLAAGITAGSPPGSGRSG
jgi:hypothetical protein